MAKYIIEYRGPGHDDDGNEIPIVNQGWRVYELRYAQTYMGRKVKTNRAPYRTLRGVFETEAEAQTFVSQRR